jgi:mono/diheme cytochrome c family protein
MLLLLRPSACRSFIGSIVLRRMLAAGCIAGVFTVTGCEKLMNDMYDQPRYKPLAASPIWPDGASARPIEPGTVVHGGGAIAAASSGRRGVAQLPEPPSADFLPTVTLATLQRGRERFDIFCAPCHSPAGDGDGIIVRRGFPRPPSFHTDRLRAASDSHVYSVITDGYGVMYPHADRIAPNDRRAIVAYVRALQLSRHATLADVPAEELATLQGSSR